MAIFHLLFRSGDDPVAFTFSSGTTLAAKCHCMSWVILIVASLFEIAWAVGLKFTEGFTRLWPTVGTLAAMAVSVWLLGVAAKSLPIGTAYAVWTGMGAVGTVLCGIAFLGDPATPARLCCLGFVIIGILGLKFTS